MANTYTTLNGLFTAIADAIRAKKETTDAIAADSFPAEIEGLRSGFDYNNHEITSISDYAFYNCEDLNNVNCYNVTSVGANAFENCTNLKTIILCDGVTNIGENAFKGCINATIYCMFDNQPDTWHENWNPDNCKVVWGMDLIETWNISATENDNVIAKLYQFPNITHSFLVISGNGNMREFIDYYTGLSDKPWKLYDNSIVSVVINDNITNIGKGAFASAPNLVSVSIPNSVTSIGGYAFINDKKISNIYIPNGVSCINTNTFCSCASLKSLTIPTSVTKIDYQGLFDIQNLTSIFYPGTVSQWNAIAFGDRWNRDTGDYTIHCTDGDIAKDGTVTYHTTA